MQSIFGPLDGRIRSIAHRRGINPDDLLQETWFRCQLRGIGSCPRSHLKGILRVADNIACSWRRSGARQRNREKHAARIEHVRDRSLDDIESRDLVEATIQTLSGRYAEALRHIHLDGMSFEEFAQVKNLSTATVRSRCHQAIKQCRKKLTK